MIQIYMDPSRINHVGRVQENQAVQIRFQVVRLYEQMFGVGRFELVIQRKYDDEPYAVVSETDGNDVVYNLTSAETEIAGLVECELRYYSGESIAKTSVYRLAIDESLHGQSENPPEPWTDWVDNVIKNGAKVDEFAEKQTGGTPGQVWTQTEQGPSWKNPTGGEGGTSDHRQLTNRDADNQHPISAITGLQDELDGKMPADTPIPQAVTEQTVAGWGFTKNTGTYSKPSTGIPKTDLASSVKTSLGKADTAMQPGDLADWAKASTKPRYTASEVGALPADTPIPTEVTEQTVTDWGFTKNTGTYSKPSGGIPMSDFESAVQTSLEKADSAVQPEAGKGLFSGNYNDLKNKPTIPPAVTDAHINSLIDAKLGDLDTAVTMLEGVV